ncbi:MAG: VCBS repeat-containing protein [Myxococcota bacterium]|jgi:hypothetical protein|nr:VCBS repeat-containing protein [Myxococcota bacterium]
MTSKPTPLFVPALVAALLIGLACVPTKPLHQDELDQHDQDTSAELDQHDQDTSAERDLPTELSDDDQDTELVDLVLPEDTQAACSDGLDNDADGLLDCADEGCQSFPECSACYGVECSLPPPSCQDSQTLQTPIAMRCEQGDCIPEFDTSACPNGCRDGRCVEPGLGYSNQSLSLPPSTASTTDVLIVDVNQDGANDLLWVNQADSQGQGGGLLLHLNDGSANFTVAPLSLPEDFGAWTFALPFDVDNDGDTDFFLTRPAMTRASVALVRNQAGTLVHDNAAVPFASGQQNGLVFGRAAAGDVDGDGDLDVLVPVFSTADFSADARNLLYINDGDRFSFDASRLPTLPTGEDYTLSAAMGDFDGDGDVDIFLGQAQKRPRLLFNDGSGRFTDATSDASSNLERLPNITTQRCARSAALDFDRDGDQDIVVINDAITNLEPPQAVPNTLFVNDGRGVFELLELPSTGDRARDTRALEVADFDGDGWLDLVIGNAFETVPHLGRPVEILRNTREGGFELVPDLPSLTGIGIYGVACADLDGQGWLDVAGAAAEPSTDPGAPNILFTSP